MIYLLTVKEINSFKEHILFTKSIIILGNYIRSRNYIHFKELISSFNEIIFIQRNIFIQGKFIHSGKLYPFKEICLFEEHIFVQVQGHMFIQGNYIHLTMLRSRT